MYQLISVWDYFLAPIYIFIIYQIANNFCNRHYPPGHPWRSYFLKGLLFKIVGAIFISLIYQFIYDGGDTTLYYIQSQVVNSAFSDSPVKWINLIFRNLKGYEGEYMKYFDQLIWYDSAANYMPIRITALFGILTFNNYLCTSILLAGVAYTGLWALFRIFATQYPRITPYVALCCLFIPSVALWGSGIFKDTICMFCLGWVTYCTFQLFIKRDVSPSNLIMLIMSVYIIYITKIYIIMAFIPSLAIWILLRYNYKIKSSFVRSFLAPLLIVGVSGASLQVATTYGALLGGYSLDKITESSEITREYILSTSDKEGSGYSLGEIEPGIGGILKKGPAAINVALFRPYIWEARKPIVLLNAIEATIFLFLTIRLLYKLGLKKVWNGLRNDPNVQFFLVFTMIFALAVGISSYNFGALSRYRIPMLPFYGLALGIIWYQYKTPGEERFTAFEDWV